MRQGEPCQYTMNDSQYFRWQNRREAFFLLFDTCLQVTAPTVGAMVDHFMLASPWEPRAGLIPCGKNRNTRSPNRSGKMHRTAVVTQKKFGACQHGGGFARNKFPA